MSASIISLGVHVCTHLRTFIVHDAHVLGPGVGRAPHRQHRLLPPLPPRVGLCYVHMNRVRRGTSAAPSIINTVGAVFLTSSSAPFSATSSTFDDDDDDDNAAVAADGRRAGGGTTAGPDVEEGTVPAGVLLFPLAPPPIVTDMGASNLVMCGGPRRSCSSSSSLSLSPSPTRSHLE